MRVGREVFFYRFQQDLSPSLNFSFSKLSVSLLSKELIRNVNCGQNSQLCGSACSGFLGEGTHLRINIPSQLMKIRLISLSLERDSMTKDFDFNGPRHS
jgi:hypothetical protein